LAARRRASVIELTCLGRPDIVAMACACLSTPELPQPVEELLAAHADGIRSSSRSYSPPRLLPGL
ncbi:MAG: hypothetical protein M3O70_20455, partial [Actinomycetota bacterium]|nr:hypothetical protein [Actinomycetota bacterium]